VTGSEVVASSCNQHSQAWFLQVCKPGANLPCCPGIAQVAGSFNSLRSSFFVPWTALSPVGKVPGSRPSTQLHQESWSRLHWVGRGGAVLELILSVETYHRAVVPGAWCLVPGASSVRRLAGAAKSHCCEHRCMLPAVCATPSWPVVAGCVICCCLRHAQCMTPVVSAR
jgi:hypothetical protein